MDSIAKIARGKSIFHLQNNLIHAIEIMCNNCCAKYTDVDIIFHICIFHCTKNNVYNYFILFFTIYIYILIIFIVQTILTWALNKKKTYSNNATIVANVPILLYTYQCNRRSNHLMIDSLTLSDWLDMLLAYTIVGIHFLAAHIQSICCHYSCL